jgi:peptidoglycan-N-acetylglucosamine deacetylase
LNILTVDLEDWFHILDMESSSDVKAWSDFESRFEANVDWLLEALDETKTPCTFFCLGWIAKKYPKKIREICSLGYQIGSHGSDHRLVYQSSPSTFRKDTLQSKFTIEDLLGQRVDYFRAPGFSVVNSCAWALNIIAESGFLVDSSMVAGRHVHGGFVGCPEEPVMLELAGGGQLIEFPLTVSGGLFGVNFYVGGGYFRLMPGYISENILRNASYHMTYFHPRDFDPGQPFLDGLGPVRAFRSYYGLGRSRAKFKSLLRNLNFSDLRMALEYRAEFSTLRI